MRCSSCGKDIPFTGKVCPYCQRDKSDDKLLTFAAVVCGFLGGYLGSLVFDFWGTVVSGFVGCGIGVALAAPKTSKTSKPPQVQVVIPQPVPPSHSAPTPASSPLYATENATASKLAHVKKLYEQGLITAEEFARKKAEILSKI